jgi:hypothetical protein
MALALDRLEHALGRWQVAGAVLLLIMLGAAIGG